MQIVRVTLCRALGARLTKVDCPDELSSYRLVNTDYHTSDAKEKRGQCL